MGKRIFYALTLLVVAGIGVYLWFHFQKPKTLVLQYPPLYPAANGWPADRCWNWTFQFPDTPQKPRLGLLLRQKTKPLPKDDSRDYTPSPIMEKDEDRHFGSSIFGGVDTINSGTVTIQLLDLAEVGVTSSTLDKNLRVLGKISIGGMQMPLGDNHMILPGKKLAGYWTRDDTQWENGELRLMTFWVEVEQTMTQYDVMVKQSAP